jgi:hypothetical protein
VIGGCWTKVRGSAEPRAFSRELIRADARCIREPNPRRWGFDAMRGIENIDALTRFG